MVSIKKITTIHCAINYIQFWHFSSDGFMGYMNGEIINV